MSKPIGVKAKVITALEHGPKTASQLAQATGLTTRQVTVAVTKDRRRELRAFYIMSWAVVGDTLQPIYALGDSDDAPRPSPLTDLICSHLQKNPFSTTEHISNGTGVLRSTVRAMLAELRKRNLVYIGDWQKRRGMRPVAQWVYGEGKDAPAPFDFPPPRRQRHSEIIDRLRNKGPSPWQQLL